MLLEEVAAASADVAATSSRLKKVERLSSILSGLRPDEVPIAVAYLSGALPHGSIGVGWASLRDVPSPVTDATLELVEIDETLRRIGGLAGAGSLALAEKRSTICSAGRHNGSTTSCAAS